jgi:hypothetical protein
MLGVLRLDRHRSLEFVGARLRRSVCAISAPQRPCKAPYNTKGIEISRPWRAPNPSSHAGVAPRYCELKPMAIREEDDPRQRERANVCASEGFSFAIRLRLPLPKELNDVEQPRATRMREADSLPALFNFDERTIACNAPRAVGGRPQPHEPRVSITGGSANLRRCGRCGYR